LFELNWILENDLLPVAAKALPLFQKSGKKPQHENDGTCAQSEDQLHIDRPDTIVRKTPQPSFDDRGRKVWLNGA